MLILVLVLRMLGVQSIGTAGLRFADADALAGSLKVPQGHVTPLALINDEQKQVSVLLDKVLAEAPSIGVHPLTNAATTFLSGADMVAFLVGRGVEHKIVDFDALDAASTPASAAPAAAAAGGAPKKGGGKAASSAAAEEEKSLLGLTATKEGDFPEWYSQVITRSEYVGCVRE